MNEPSPPRLAALFGVIVLLGMVLRLVGVDDPVGTRRGAAWREADIGAIARGFHREGMNPLYPRIAWRGDGPGFVESELPVLPYVTAALYGVFGESDLVPRLLTALVALASLLVFVGLARRTLPPVGALAASLAFAANPLLVFLGSAVQPDPIMLLLLLLAFSSLERWNATDAPRALLLTAAWLSLAILAKGTAVHFGLLLAVVCLRKLGLRALLTPRVLAAAAIAIAPALLWYGWAHHLWSTWGNSLGLSNEAHLIGPELFTEPKFVVGLVHRQVIDVFSAAGLVLAGIALLRRNRTPVSVLAALWAGAAFVFFLIAARTAARGWAFYYHAVSVPAASLLIGAGFATIVRTKPDVRMWRAFRIAGLVLALAAVAVAVAADGPARLLASGLAVSLLGTAAFAGTVAGESQPGSAWQRLTRSLGPAVPSLLLALAVAQLGAVALKHALVRDPEDHLHRVRTCTRALGGAVPPEERIVVEGGNSVDEDGYPVAYDRSMLFYFMDRAGFTFPGDAPVESTLAAIAERGGRWFVAADRTLGSRPRLRRTLEARGAVVARCETHSLVDLYAWRAAPRAAVRR